MTKILIASDSFKGSASSSEIESFIATGIHQVASSAETICVPIADGGEGTVTSLVSARHGHFYHTAVTGPLGDRVTATWGMLNNNEAILEVAESSGITLVKDRLNPVLATTYGLGELIMAAINKGATRIYIGLGGSATNDGGVGMAQAIGIRFLDAQDNDLPLGVKKLSSLKRIDSSGVDPRLKEAEFIGLSDVTNPLVGKSGASAVFGPQKGASTSVVQSMDQALLHLKQVVNDEYGSDFSLEKGAGAAGGTGFGLMTFLGGTLVPGIQTLVGLLHLPEQMESCDLVITGEGKMDDQSLMGKAPVGIARLAKKFGLPVIALVGSFEGDFQKMKNSGIDLVLPIINKPMTIDEAIDHVESLAKRAAATAYMAYRIPEKSK